MDDGAHYWNGKYVEDEPIWEGKKKKFCICSVEFQMRKKRFKDTSH